MCKVNDFYVTFALYEIVGIKIFNRRFRTCSALSGVFCPVLQRRHRRCFHPLERTSDSGVQDNLSRLCRFPCSDICPFIGKIQAGKPPFQKKTSGNSSYRKCRFQRFRSVVSVQNGTLYRSRLLFPAQPYVERPSLCPRIQALLSDGSGIQPEIPCRKNSVRRIMAYGDRRTVPEHYPYGRRCRCI